MSIALPIVDRIVGVVEQFQSGQIKRDELAAMIGKEVIGEFGEFGPLGIAGLILSLVLAIQLLHYGGVLEMLLGVPTVYRPQTETAVAIEAALVVVLLGGNHKAFREVLFGIRDWLEERKKRRDG